MKILKLMAIAALLVGGQQLIASERSDQGKSVALALNDLAQIRDKTRQAVDNVQRFLTQKNYNEASKLLEQLEIQKETLEDHKKSLALLGSINDQVTYDRFALEAMRVTADISFLDSDIRDLRTIVSWYIENPDLTKIADPEHVMDLINKAQSPMTAEQMKQFENQFDTESEQFTNFYFGLDDQTPAQDAKFNALRVIQAYLSLNKRNSQK